MLAKISQLIFANTGSHFVPIGNYRDARQLADCLARMFHELMSRDHDDGRATRSAGACAACRVIAGARTRGVLDSTSQGARPEDAREDDLICGRSR